MSTRVEALEGEVAMLKEALRKLAVSVGEADPIANL